MKILFLCVANSARSQIAEGLAKKMWGPKVRVESAGSVPSGKVNPFAVETLTEIGIDTSSHYSKSIDSLDKEFLENLDYVITLCAEEVCPIFISKAKKLNWGMPDPASVNSSDLETAEAFLRTRNKIEEKLEAFTRTHTELNSPIPTEFQIRAAKSEDLPTVKQLFLDYAKSLNFSLCFQDFDVELETLPGQYTSPSGDILIALTDSKIVGCVAFRSLDGGAIEMKRLYVAPDHRGKKVGTKLTEAVIHAAEKRNFKYVRLDTVPAMKSAIQMYRSMGFKEISPYYDSPVAGALFMEKRLSVSR